MNRNILTLSFLLLLAFPFIVALNAHSPTIDDVLTNVNEYENYQKSSYSNLGDVIIPNSEKFGNQEKFWVRDFSSYSYYRINVTLLAVGNWSYVYMDNRTVDDIGIVEAIKTCKIFRDEFDSIIYPKAIEFAGHPDGILGDIDGDPHVSIVFLPFIFHTGYYSAINEEVTYPYSNRREMVYIDTDISVLEAIKTLAHEFNHLIFSNNDPEDAVFIGEGIAEYAILYTGYLSNSSYLLKGQGYNLTDFSMLYADSPDVSLLCWDPGLSNMMINYASAYLFIFYFAEKYGVDILRELIQTDIDGPAAIELVLLNNGFNIAFNEVYLNWITACTLDLQGVHNNIYAFENADFKINEMTPANIFPHKRDRMKLNYYGFDVTKLEVAPDLFTLQIDTPKSPYGLGIVSAIYDSNGWNITKKIIFKENGTIAQFYSGEDIEYAYILTSLIKNSPAAPLVYYSPPFDKLDYNLLEGHINLTGTPSKTGYTDLIILTLSLFFSNLILNIRRKR
ncbi:MAG: hypothetical protein H7645_04125 [Candidatus Heimdallarchaeota archaeon]|nr:hypothetical protein [Candidatus Heimdallarchaeota archaeon]MCK4769504.1 hypothetical protein [Candidatus Heimdallarchaeota archaeon]